MVERRGLPSPYFAIRVVVALRRAGGLKSHALALGVIVDRFGSGPHLMRPSAPCASGSVLSSVTPLLNLMPSPSTGMERPATVSGLQVEELS
jgi:hypothetical protein